MVLIGGSLAFAVSAALASCGGPTLGDGLCTDVSEIGEEGPADDESDDDEGTAGDVDSADDAAGADGEGGVRAAKRCFATSSDRLHAPSARLSANSDTSAT